MEDLKPCPICGKQPVRMYVKMYGRYTGHEESNVRFPSKQGHIECKRCGFGQTHDYLRMSLAEEAWNRRK